MNKLSKRLQQKGHLIAHPVDFTGTNFPLQPDGTLRCPAGNVLVPHERRREHDGSLRVVYSASIRACRPCPLREQCQWSGSATAKPTPA